MTDEEFQNEVNRAIVNARGLIPCDCEGKVVVIDNGTIRIAQAGDEQKTAAAVVPIGHGPIVEGQWAWLVTQGYADNGH